MCAFGRTSHPLSCQLLTTIASFWFKFQHERGAHVHLIKKFRESHRHVALHRIVTVRISGAETPWDKTQERGRIGGGDPRALQCLSGDVQTPELNAEANKKRHFKGSTARAGCHLVIPKFFQQVAEGSIGAQAAKHAEAARKFLEEKRAMPASIQR